MKQRQNAEIGKITNINNLINQISKTTIGIRLTKCSKLLMTFRSSPQTAGAMVA